MFAEIPVGVAVFVSACISIFLTRAPGGIALLWPSTAIAAALLIRLPRVRWGRAVASVFAAFFLANLTVGHRSWPIAGLFTCVNLGEMGLMVAAFRIAWRLPYPYITIAQAALMMAIFGVAIPGIMSLLGGLLLHVFYGTPLLPGTLQWWVSHTVGACLLGPPIILFSVKGLKRLVRERFLVENTLTFLGCLAGCYLTIRFVRFPFVTIELLLLSAAFRIGGFGAALMSLCLGLLMTNLWMLGIRPLGLDPAAAKSSTLVGLPVIALLATLMLPIAVGLGSDARRAAVRALRASERRFREAMKHSPIGMLLSDLNGIWTYSNLALQQMLGYTAEELRALPPGGPSAAEDWKESESRWRKLLSGENDYYDTTRRFRHKDGHWVWAHVAVSVLRDEEGLPLHLIAQIENLEARQRAEENLADERERLRITLGSINDAVITTDAGARITYINAAAESLLGLLMATVEDRRVDEVIHLTDPKTSRAAANLIGQTTLHGRVFRREQACLLHRPDGAICYVTDVVSPVLDTAGQLNGLVIVFHDATLEVDRARDLQHRALHDPLTGLSNRDDFEETLRTVFYRARLLSRPAAVLAIDLDRFKAVNDTAGHAAGDAVLQQVAQLCRARLRSTDTVARLGGDEFAVILDNCPESQARLVGEKLLRALNPLEIAWRGASYEIGASIGLAMRTAEMPDESAWLEAADRACYAAKRDGRGRLQVEIGRADDFAAN
jgi:diguanylate cyclase